MPAANDRGNIAARAAVDRPLLDATRRRLRAGATDDGEWTACATPGRVVVVDPDGSLRACEFASGPLLGGDAAVADLQAHAAATMGPILAAAELPLPHCAGCARWCAADLHSAAPLVREAVPGAAAAGQARAVVRLDASGRNARQDDPAFLAWLAGCATACLEGDDVLGSPFALDLLQRLRGAAEGPRLAIRTRVLPTAARCRELLAAADLESLTLLQTAVDDGAVATLAAAARGRSVPARVRFVLTPAGWFDFERAIEVAAAHGVAVDLRVLDRDGHAPLEDLSAEQASLLRDGVAERWGALVGPSRPASLGENDFDQLCQELRALVARRVDAAPAGAAADFALPPLDHPWHAGDAATGWRELLFRNGHIATVRAWLVAAASPAALRSRPWLRALAHRVSYETQSEPALAALREAYDSEARRRRLAVEDDRFADQSDLRRFGGPWAERIGLGAPRRRRRPFVIGAPAPLPADGGADVTVVIPSYRHADFVKETIESVLAQRGARFRVLVVDDRSPDRTVDVARSLQDPRVEVRVNERNLGLGNSVLQALDDVTTEYVALLNSDDLLHPDHLATCLQTLLDDPATMLVCTDIQPVDAKGGKLDPEAVSLVRDGRQIFEWIRWHERSRPRSDVPPERTFGELLERNYLVTSSNLFARTAWLRRQAASLRSLKYCLDWRLFLQAAAESALRHVRRPLIAYRLHATNTVWFDANRRYTYYLELNRVVAEALREFAANRSDAHAVIDRVLEAVARHAAHNAEVDGFALFLNAAVDALALERTATESPAARELLMELSAAADRRREGPPPAAAGARDVGSEVDSLRSLLSAERGQRRWLVVENDRLGRDLAASDALQRRIWDEKQRLEQTRIELERQASVLRDHAQAVEGTLRQRSDELRDAHARNDELRRLHEHATAQLAREQQRLREKQAEVDGLLVDVAGSTTRLEAALREGAALRDDLARTRGEADATAVALANATADLAGTRETLAATTADLAGTRETLAATAADLAGTRADLAATAADLAGTAADLAGTRDALAASRAEAAGLDAALAKTQLALQDVRSLQRETRAELDRVRGSREQRLGDFVWNRLPLGAISRRLKKWLRLSRDARMRLSLRLRSAPADTIRAVVASTRSWPVHSHTFVYQEASCLVEAGIDVRYFFWDRELPDRLHQAFAGLRPRAVQLQSVWSRHEKDRAWFERTRPQEFRSFLERVAAASGKSVEELRDDGIVLRGCTFARLAELSRADYLHSYFFYDMSFMAMMASWLLGIPRGITCYADHMLADFPWKLVPLHLEQCDVIVATSERIRRELLALAGGRFGDKIVVKPNGVDGRRFVAVDRGVRAPGEPFELLSVSRIEPKKGLVHLVDAVVELAARGVDARVHLVGAEDPHSPDSLEYGAEFRAHLARSGVADRFTLHGALQQERLAPLLARCRAFVAPYVEVASGDKDGIPTAVLESMAAGLPVVAFASGSIPEAVEDGREGLIVAPRDVGALASAMQRLADDPGLERRLGAAARASFERRFDVAVTESRLHERIRAVVAARK